MPAYADLLQALLELQHSFCLQLGNHRQNKRSWIFAEQQGQLHHHLQRHVLLSHER